MEDKRRIDELREELYKRNYQQKDRDVRPHFSQPRRDVQQEWEEGNVPEEQDMSMKKKKKRISGWGMFLIASVLFFCAALAGAAYLFLGGGNVVSSENVDIEIVGPTTVGGGDEISLQIIIANNNNAALQFTDLLVEFPEGAHDVENENEILDRYRTSLDVIKPGESVNEIIRAKMFGEEGAERVVNVTLEYRVEGSNAIFVKEAQHGVTLSSSPLSAKLAVLGEVNANQEVDLDIEVSSNSDEVVEDVLVRVEYPFGFEPKEASRSASYSNNMWEVGDLAPNQTWTLTITGVVKAQDEEEKVFSVHAGKQDPNDERSIATVYSSSIQEVHVKRPFVGLSISLNGDASEDPTGSGGEKVQAKINWKNNLPSQVENVVIEAQLVGEVLDRGSVRVRNGFFNSSTNTIVWNRQSEERLAIIPAGEDGTVEFDFVPKSLLSPDVSSLRNPEITIILSVRGVRVSEENVTESVEAALTRTMRINSALRLTSRATYYAGPITNTGPIPPKAEQETTYTITWTVANSSNDIAGARVTASVPAYVNWKGVTVPSGENISFNPVTGTITWNVGDVLPGVGVTHAPKEVSFQIGFVPSINQVGSTPVLVHDIQLRGADTFTGDTIINNKADLNTRLHTDPGAGTNHERVVQ